ncbi:MAG: hypothetical protein SPK70_10685 [Succinivibrio dextrinosolvens]|nr:hypothetical protein [Succinivibrio dextrinosolvens]MDY6466124.1 hypothetical protein [Succinivibrio dextrinosolvens]MDY6471521.1 hypothetical protein [Succinivibrio dextrinosolvens]
MKTFDIKDVLSAVNIQEAKQYVGKNGYFGSNLIEIQKAVQDGDADTLGAIDEKAKWGAIFQYAFNLVGHNCSTLFLPADKVKDDGRRYREIDTYKEFIAVTGVALGKILSIRLRDNPEIETRGIFSSIVECKNKLQGVDIGGASYTMHDLYKRYEFYNLNDSEWAPFCLEVV